MTFKSKLNTITLAAVVTGTIALTGAAQAEQHHYPKLTPADPPCLFLMDENGNSTGNAVNAPCTQSAATGKELDKSSPMLMRGKAANRKRGSGMATGRR
ncbi:MAG: hypothetical protein O2910_02595 [Proteobacteria bacterium]|jgi:hypothetical protein|nr:hypothetical protein [Pseudomonadota bacterium]